MRWWPPGNLQGKEEIRQVSQVAERIKKTISGSSEDIRSIRLSEQASLRFPSVCLQSQDSNSAGCTSIKGRAINIPWCHQKGQLVTCASFGQVWTRYQQPVKARLERRGPSARSTPQRPLPLERGIIHSCHQASPWLQSEHLAVRIKNVKEKIALMTDNQNSQTMYENWPSLDPKQLLP